jgi:glutamine---fructose-6-phosphate transaminase (isomerizing)
VETLLSVEIAAQPAVLARLRASEGARLTRLGARLAALRPRGLLIAARGSSDHAAVYAQYLFGLRARLPVALAAPSLFTVYDAAPRLDGWIVIAISQSGASPDVVSVVAEARRQGVPSVALTDNAASDLARVADEVVPLCVDGERSVAATATFTASLFALAHLVAGWCGVDESSALAAVPERAERALASRGPAAALTRELVSADLAYVIGRGLGFPVALEWALKLKEVCGLHAEPYSAADYRHGPIAVATEGVPALLIDVDGPARSDLAALAEQLRARGARVLRASDDGAGDLPFPAGPEWLAPIPAAIAGQLLALELGLARGRDPDRPPGLSKVTRTR